MLHCAERPGYCRLRQVAHYGLVTSVVTGPGVGDMSASRPTSMFGNDGSDAVSKIVREGSISTESRPRARVYPSGILFPLGTHSSEARRRGCRATIAS